MHSKRKNNLVSDVATAAGYMVVEACMLGRDFLLRYVNADVGSRGAVIDDRYIRLLSTDWSVVNMSTRHNEILSEQKPFSV